MGVAHAPTAMWAVTARPAPVAAVATRPMRGNPAHPKGTKAPVAIVRRAKSARRAHRVWTTKASRWKRMISNPAQMPIWARKAVSTPLATSRKAVARVNPIRPARALTS